MIASTHQAASWLSRRFGSPILVGVTMIGGGALSAVAVAAIFIPNIPEGLSSSAGTMKWVSTNPSLGAGKSSLSIGAPPHPLIAAAGRRLPEPTRTGRDWLAGVGRARRVDRDAHQHTAHRTPRTGTASTARPPGPCRPSRRTPRTHPRPGPIPLAASRRSPAAHQAALEK